MAFIPDDALDRYEELQPKSQLAYSFLCRYRNHKTGVTHKTIAECAEKYGWSRATKFNVQKELIDEGWIEQTKGYLRLLVGDFSPVTKSKNLDDEHSQMSKNLDSQSKNLDEMSKNLDSHIRNNQHIPAFNQQLEETSNEVSSQRAKNKLGKYFEQVAEVFAFWQNETNHCKTVLDQKRKSKILARLSEGFSVAELKKAVLGCRASPWHNGSDPKSDGTVYDSITVVFRDSEQVEKFINIANNGVKLNGNSNYRNGNNAKIGYSDRSAKSQATTAETLARLGITPQI
jgi:hypothetical protein